MEHDFFKYANQIIARDNEAGRCDAAHNREMSLRCLAAFLGKEQLPFSELTPELMVQFEAWLLTNGRKASTSRLYLNQINAIYNYAVKENLVPKIKLLKGVKTTIPAKQDRELLTDTELRRMRYADLSDSRPMSFARDMFFFQHLRPRHQFHRPYQHQKKRHQGFLLTYTSQAISQPRITVQWDSAMQEIADRYPSDTEYLFPSSPPTTKSKPVAT